MILSSVQKRRNKAILSFTDSYEITISYEVYLDSGIFKGDEVDSNKLKLLEYEDNLYQIKTSSLRYLGNRSHSSFELKQKLIKKGHKKKDIEIIIEELTTKGFLDDYQFAERFVQNRIETKKNGIIKIKSELFQRGINHETISEVISKFSEDSVHIQNAVILLTNKYNSIKNKNLEYQKLKAKLFNHLRSKGFTNDVIVNALDKVLKNNETSDDYINEKG